MQKGVNNSVQDVGAKQWMQQFRWCVQCRPQPNYTYKVSHKPQSVLSNINSGSTQTNKPVLHTSRASSASSGVASVATCGPSPLPAVAPCNTQTLTDISNVHNVLPTGNHESGPLVFKPLPRAVAKALLKYNREKRRSGIRIRPWTGPQRCNVPSPSSGANVKGTTL